ncbi:MAG: hypothetical protein KDI45_17155, partial [Candidatus Accumulibacter sp.]|nr:hypothetical protein [Accumulibacter sp.]
TTWVWVGSGRSEKIEAAGRRNFFPYVRSGRYTGRPRHVPPTAALADEQSLALTAHAPPSRRAAVIPFISSLDVAR